MSVVSRHEPIEFKFKWITIIIIDPVKRVIHNPDDEEKENSDDVNKSIGQIGGGGEGDYEGDD